MCRKCALLLAKDTAKCPFCSASARLKELKQVVLSYGECDPSLLLEQEMMTCPASDDTVVDPPGPATLERDPIISRGEQTLRLLGDIANSDPLDWRRPSSGGGHDRGLLFARAGRVINDIESRLEGSDGVKVSHKQ